MMNRNQVKNINVFWYTYLRIVYFFIRIYYALFGNKENLNPRKTIMNETTEYIENQKTRFSKSLEKSLNSNIDSLFYSKQEFQNMILEESNPLEKQWRTRILFETTPRGNIIMYYDCYKLGFAYYSDTNGIPYNVLNSVAMKYVSLYNCHDFFMDNEITTKNSPLIKIHFEEPKKDEAKTDEKNGKTDGNPGSQNNKNETQKDAPFAKFKNYNNVSSRVATSEKNKEKTDKSEKLDENQGSQKEYNRNRFICLGKICNFQILQKEKKNYKTNGFKSKLLNGVTSESELQKKVMSYRDYKNMLRSANKLVEPVEPDES
jgi:hypothetical protein